MFSKYLSDLKNDCFFKISIYGGWRINEDNVKYTLQLCVTVHPVK